MKLAVPVALAAAFALAVGDEAWAGKGRGGGSRASSGSSAKSSAATRSHHRHHHSRGGTVIVGTALIGSAFWYPRYAYPAYYPGPYYYGPDFAVRYSPPKVYIEKFDGDPSTAAEDFILCPQSDTLYPEAKECPGGWARIVRE